MKKLCLFLFLLCSVISSHAQKIDDIILDGWYTGSLTEVLDRISKEKGLVFSFDRDYAAKIQIDAPPFKRTVDNFLTYVVCHKNKLKYFIDETNVIHIVEIWKQVEEGELHKRKSVKTNASRFNITLSGKVVDKDNNESLPFVNIFVPATKSGTSTNADGLFTVLNIPSDTSSITISYIGYKPQVLKLEPDLDIHNLIIRLEPATELLNEVVILSEKQDLLQTNERVGLIKMTPLKMNILPSLGEKDIFRTFQLMPGISAANENSSGLYVRGGTPDQSLVLYDGIPIFNVQHLFGFYSAFNSNAIKDIQLYKGGFDAKYGGRLSSVVEITGKEGNQKDFGAAVDLSLMSANGYIEFPIGKKITFLAAGRRSWQSPLYNKIYKQSTNSNNSKPSGSAPEGGMTPPGGFKGQKNETTIDSYFYDVNSKLTYRPTSNDILSISVYNGADDFDNSFNPSISRASFENKDITKWGNTGAAFKWAHTWGLKLYSNLLLSYSNYFNNRNRSTTSPTSMENTTTTTESTCETNHLNDYSAKLDFEYQLTGIQKLLFGIHLSNTKTNYYLNENDTTNILNTISNAKLVSFYAQDNFSFFNKKLDLSAGLRGNYYEPTNKVYFEPRMNASYNINSQWKLKASAGSYYQFAKKITREDIMQGNRDFWLMADGDKMPVGSSLQGVIGVAYETKNYLIDVETYYKKLHHISEYSIRTSNMNQGFNGNPGFMGGGMNTNSSSTQYNDCFYIGNGYARGIDVLMQKKYGDYTGWISYTLGEVVHNFPDLSESKYYASNDVRHEFKIVNIYKWRNWDFSANWLIASGKPYTAPEGLYRITLPDGTVKSYFTPSSKNGNRLPTYHRLDLAATYSFKIMNRFACAVNISAFNIYNHKNVWYKEFNIVDEEIVETNINYLGITPNLSFSIKF